MLKYKIVELALFLNALIGKLDFEASRLDVVQSPRYYNIEYAGYIPVFEISGLTFYNEKLYAITDSGGEAVIYQISQNLIITDTIQVQKASNIDWESITSDTSGAFYVGDIGNNFNTRQNLRIYLVSGNNADTIKISYQQQHNFPPPEDKMNFDSEATFWHQGNLHLFSKNRGKKCVKHYIFPDTPGEYALLPKEELWLNSFITGAAVSPDQKIVVLSGYGKIYFFKLNDDMLFQQPVMLIETTKFGQNEAVTFLDQNTLLICNEAGEFFRVSFELPEI